MPCRRPSNRQQQLIEPLSNRVRLEYVYEPNAQPRHALAEFLVGVCLDRARSNHNAQEEDQDAEEVTNPNQEEEGRA